MYVQIIKYMTGKFKAKYKNKYSETVSLIKIKTSIFLYFNFLFDNYMQAIQFPTYYTDHINFNA